jgi:GTP pyrophosphokinase
VNTGPQIQSPPHARPGDALAGLCAVLRVTRPAADVELIRRAYDVAAVCHQGQTRKSGDPYITHPLAVATILAGTSADDEMLCAALLHDTVEDTPYTLAELHSEFGAGVAALVAGVAALDRPRPRRSRMAAWRRAVAESGTGVLEIKIADRLHNMRTLDFIPPVKQVRKARESLAVFVPAASRLSLGPVGTELETLARATLKRNWHVRSASGRLLVAVTALLPATTRTRWCEEWLGELHTLSGRAARARFAAHTALGIPRLAWTVRADAGDHRRSG